MLLNAPGQVPQSVHGRYYVPEQDNGYGYPYTQRYSIHPSVPSTPILHLPPAFDPMYAMHPPVFPDLGPATARATYCETPHMMPLQPVDPNAQPGLAHQSSHKHLGPHKNPSVGNLHKKPVEPATRTKTGARTVCTKFVDEEQEEHSPEPSQRQPEKRQPEPRPTECEKEPQFLNFIKNKFYVNLSESRMSDNLGKTEEVKRFVVPSDLSLAQEAVEEQPSEEEVSQESAENNKKAIADLLLKALPCLAKKNELTTEQTEQSVASGPDSLFQKKSMTSNAEGDQATMMEVFIKAYKKDLERQIEREEEDQSAIEQVQADLNEVRERYQYLQDEYQHLAAKHVEAKDLSSKLSQQLISLQGRIAEGAKREKFLEENLKLREKEMAQLDHRLKEREKAFHTQLDQLLQKQEKTMRELNDLKRQRMNEMTIPRSPQVSENQEELLAEIERLKKENAELKASSVKQESVA